MKKISLKLLSMLMALSIIFSLAACGRNTENKADKSMVTQKESTSAAKNEVVGPLGKYEQTISLTSVRDTASSYSYPEGQDINNNMWIQEIEQKLGIKVVYNWTVDQTQYGQKLDVTLASGDIPDFFGCSPKTFMNLARGGKLADLGFFYEKYTTPELKEAMNAFQEGFDSGKVDGKLQGLSIQNFGNISLGNVVWIRDDWMKKYNLQAPKTMDDLAKIAETFVANKPDGQKGTYGIALNKDIYGGLEAIDGIANGFHAYPTIWIKDASGQIAYGSIQPEMKNALKALQEWYKKGLISNEFGVKDVNKVNEEIVSGKVGINFGQNWLSFWPHADLVKKNKDAILRPFAIPSVDGKDVKLSISWPVSTYWVASKDCKNPEAVLKMASLYYDKEKNGTLEDRAKFIVGEKGEEYFHLSPVRIFNPANEYKMYKNVSEALKTHDTSKLSNAEKGKYNVAVKWADNKDPDGYGAYFQASGEGSYSVLHKYIDNNNIIITEMHGADTPAYASKKVTLDKLEKDTFTKIIMGSVSIDEFDKFVAIWKKLGGEEATREINEYYGKN